MDDDKPPTSSLELEESSDVVALFILLLLARTAGGIELRSPLCFLLLLRADCAKTHWEVGHVARASPSVCRPRNRDPSLLAPLPRLHHLAPVVRMTSFVRVTGPWER